jgi:nicotinamide-nucleotide amidase
MRAELVAVGDELLLGDVVNGNAAWLGRLLTDAGVEVTRATVVPDDVATIADAVRSAADRADAVIVTGGLGPTPDDLTREALAAAAGVALRRDAGLEEALARRYAEVGRPLLAVARRQADVPSGALPVPNETGSAPGLRLALGRTVVYALPGVPVEMRVMARRYVLPDLRERFAEMSPPATRLVRVALVPEPVVATTVEPLVAGRDGVRVVYLASPGEVTVRLSGADAVVVADVAEDVLAALGPAAVGVGDERLDVVVHRLLAETQATVAVAESLTGGLVAAALTDMPGASATFRGSVTAYATALKTDLLGVDAGLLAASDAVHPDVAAAMAAGVRDRLGATYGVATTGVAGPEPQDGRPVGTVYVAVAGPEGVTAASRRGPGDRAVVRRLAVVHALDLLRRQLLGVPPYDEAEHAGEPDRTVATDG